MSLLALAIINITQNKNYFIYYKEDLSTISFMAKYFFSQGVKFIIDTASSRINQGYNIIYEENYKCWNLKDKNNWVCSVVSTHDYPDRLIRIILQKMAIEGNRIYNNNWSEMNKDQNIENQYLDQLFKMYLDPNEDKFEKVKDKLADLKTKMYENIDKILARGENIEELIEKSERLADSSKKFYYSTRKLRKCCLIF